MEGLHVECGPVASWERASMAFRRSPVRSRSGPKSIRGLCPRTLHRHSLAASPARSVPGGSLSALARVAAFGLPRPTAPLDAPLLLSSLLPALAVFARSLRFAGLTFRALARVALRRACPRRPTPPRTPASPARSVLVAHSLRSLASPRSGFEPDALHRHALAASPARSVPVAHARDRLAARG